MSPIELNDRKGGGGCIRSLIIRPRESLVLCKSFNTLGYFVSSMYFVSQVFFLVLNISKKREYGDNVIESQWPILHASFPMFLHVF